MNMTDLLAKEEWAALEKELHERWGMNACAYGADGFTFTGYKNFGNPLCPAIKASPAGIQAICSVAHQNMAAKAKTTRKTVVSQCDAGMVKICVPVFSNGGLAGIVGGCGKLPEGGEIDAFAVEKATGLPEAEILALAARVAPLSAAQVREITTFLEGAVALLPG
jgi:ligand-binding sensor protein